jgi:hypothetical protein
VRRCSPLERYQRLRWPPRRHAARRLLSGSVLRRVASNPLLPPEIQLQVDLHSIDFVSNNHLQEVMAGTTATPGQVAEAVRVNSEARLRVRKMSLLIMALLAPLSIIPSARPSCHRPR